MKLSEIMNKFEGTLLKKGKRKKSCNGALVHLVLFIPLYNVFFFQCKGDVFKIEDLYLLHF